MNKPDQKNEVECPRCDGNGLSDEDADIGEDTCELCLGAGTISREEQPDLN